MHSPLNLIGLSIFFALLASLVAGDPAGQGSVEGHVKIFPLSDVNLADDATATRAETEQPYSEYPLIIRSRDRKKRIARVIADKNGNYRIELPSGDYILEVEGRVRAKPQSFTIVANQTVRIDMNIDTGIR
jgi:hypothetical protein